MATTTSFASMGCTASTTARFASSAARISFPSSDVASKYLSPRFSSPDATPSTKEGSLIEARYAAESGIFPASVANETYFWAFSRATSAGLRPAFRCCRASNLF